MKPTVADAPKQVTVSRKSLGDQIADHLRQEILLGRLAPGTALSQQGLCEVYGTSRMPVRDALRKLNHEGLVTSSGAHSEVARLTREDILDSFDFEATLHGRAGLRAAQRASQEELNELRRLHEAMVEAERNGDLEPLGDLNWKFHRSINRMARSPKLLAMLRAAAVHVPGYLTELPDWAARANREHAAIVEALGNRDGEEAERLLRRHILDAGENLARYLAENGLFESSGGR